MNKITNEFLNSEVLQLNERLRNINNWIKENPNTEPNFSEITECCGKVAEVKGWAKEVDNFELADVLNNCSQQLEWMLEQRDVLNHPFIKENEQARRVMTAVIESARKGENFSEEDIENSNNRISVFARTMGITFFIWESLQKNPYFVYGNKTELEGLLSDSLKCEDTFTLEKIGGPLLKISEGFDKDAEIFAKINNIFNYYKENPMCDPNLYEYIGVSNDVARYISKNVGNDSYAMMDHEETNENGERVFMSAEESQARYPQATAVFKMWDALTKEVRGKLIDNEIESDLKSPLFQLLNEVYYNTIQGLQEEDIEYKQMAAGVALYIAQEKRNVKKGKIPEFTYNNAHELSRMEELYQNAYNPYANIEDSPTYQVIESIRENYDKTFTADESSYGTK